MIVPKMELKKLFAWMLILSTASTFVKLILSYPCMIAGKILTGVSAGVLNVALSKCLNETIPFEVSQNYGLLVNSALTFGIFYVAFIQSLIMPFKEDGVESLRSDQMWRVGYSVQIISNLVVGAAIAFWLPALSLRNTIAKDTPEQASEMLKRVYLLNNQDDVRACYEHHKRLVSGDGSTTSESEISVSTYEAFTSQKYRLASINSFILGFLQQFTGISVICMFSI